jgi:hypothetical protein
MTRVEFFFILNGFSLFYSKEHLSSEKINCYENIFPPRFSWCYGIGRSIRISIEGQTLSSLKKKGMFIHHVYFWLKNSGNKEDKAKLIEGLKKLSKVSTIRNFYIGQPAATRREVIDSSYDVSWLLFFDNAADQESYQTDPIHLKFVEECSALWTKVVVYDTIEA